MTIVYRTSRAAIVLIAAFAVLLNVSCRPDKHAAPLPVAGWPENFTDFTIAWSAEPGLDLKTRPAVVVRAYVESFQLVRLTGDEKYFYPGFRRSVERRSNLWPETKYPAEMPWVGTERDHILKISRSGNNVTSVVCAYMYGSAQQEKNGRYSAQAGPPFEPNGGIYPVQITLTAPNDKSTLPPQIGPSRTPLDDVFGDWKITGHSGGYFTTSAWPGYEQDRDTCAAKAPDSTERRQFLTNGDHPRSEFPTLPPYPGWPAKGG